MLKSNNNDLDVEIFSRLPVKSLIRSKSVSKSWHSFISDPSFVLQFSKRRPSMTGFFYRSSDAYKEKLRYVSIDNNEGIVSEPSSCLGFLDYSAILLNSCNGLLHWHSSWHHFISNPINMKSIKIPKFPLNHFGFAISFDPSVSPHFKLVVLQVQDLDEVCIESAIFSSDTCKWEEPKLVLTLNEKTLPSSSRGILINGNLYWELMNDNLLVYDVREESARLIELPRYPIGKSSTIGCLGQSDGVLQWCKIVESKLWVWSAKNNRPDLNCGFKGTYDIRKVALEHTGDASNEVSCVAFLYECTGVLLSVAGKIVNYNFRNEEAHEVCKVVRDKNSPILPTSFFPFVHSLALSEMSIVNG